MGLPWAMFVDSQEILVEDPWESPGELPSQILGAGPLSNQAVVPRSNPVAPFQSNPVVVLPSNLVEDLQLCLVIVPLDPLDP